MGKLIVLLYKTISRIFRCNGLGHGNLFDPRKRESFIQIKFWVSSVTSKLKKVPDNKQKKGSEVNNNNWYVLAACGDVCIIVKVESVNPWDWFL